MVSKTAVLSMADEMTLPSRVRLLLGRDSELAASELAASGEVLAWAGGVVSVIFLAGGGVSI